jgi:membrane glycosyltransferase
MSHDFVEAALLRRAGWRVHMAARLGGSYEESPPTLAALLARDRRWCQGNLQHVPIVWARGLHWISRFHLLRGISAYLVAPLWLCLLCGAVLLPLRPEWGRRSGAPLHAAAGRGFDAAAVAVVFGFAVGFLLAPKVLAWVQMLRTPGEGGRFGGAVLAALNVLIETLLSTLVAPLIMLSHSRSLSAVIAGRDSGWLAQPREQGGAELSKAVRLHTLDTAIGVMLGLAALTTSARPLLWMAPVIAGLALAIPLAAVGASSRLGRAARRTGILLVPEEERPPPILARANALNAGAPQFADAGNAAHAVPQPAT